MARRTKDILIGNEGRDHSKTFRITEMSAAAAERWAMRAVLALGRAGYQVPDNFLGGGMELLASVGLTALLRVEIADAQPLMDEMLACVQIVTDSRANIVRPLIEDDIEEVETLLRIRDEVAALHVGFSPLERLRIWGLRLKEQLTSPDTQTSAI